MAPVLTDTAECAKYRGKCFVYQLRREVGKEERVYQGVLKDLGDTEAIFEAVITRNRDTFQLERVGPEVRVDFNELFFPIVTEFEPEMIREQYEKARTIRFNEPQPSTL